jgi:prevent-host-death family protein
MTFNMHDAKTRLSELIRKAEEGEEIIIARSGVPVARLTPCASTVGEKRILGEFEGQVWIGDDFDAPLPDDIMDAFTS